MRLPTGEDFQRFGPIGRRAAIKPDSCHHFLENLTVASHIVSNQDAITRKGCERMIVFPTIFLDVKRGVESDADGNLKLERAALAKFTLNAHLPLHDAGVFLTDGQ
ncbi:MAG: hypothetical protein WCJ07_14370, partial [Verrucomicrobiota bacterium]